ncbi:MAG TPA: LuxR C-terminal-related transcriptional regulator [Sphingomicrobium sp.]|nr:LuxR C-terminal-related transcriptional regulator [Sphingomicrobium sp.]
MSLEDQELIETIGRSPIAMVVTNPRLADNPLEIVNEAFCDLTLYREREIIGRNCRFLAGAATDALVRGAMRTAIAQARPILAEIVNYRADGSPFRNGIMIAPLFDSEGQLHYFLGSQVDLGPHGASSLQERRRRAVERVAELPPRQREVLERMARGLLNKQIAWELKISEKTVKMHRALLLERLDAGTSAEAIRIAIEAGL